MRPSFLVSLLLWYGIKLMDKFDDHDKILMEHLTVWPILANRVLTIEYSVERPRVGGIQRYSYVSSTSVPIL